MGALRVEDLQQVAWTGRASVCDELLAVIDSIAPGALLERVWLVLSHLADGRLRDPFARRLLEHAGRGVVDDLALDALVRLGGRLDAEPARQVLRAVKRAPHRDTWYRRIEALAELGGDERIVTEALDGLSKELLGWLLGAARVGAAALARWLPLANADDPADLAALGHAPAVPVAARVLYGRPPSAGPAPSAGAQSTSADELEPRSPHVVSALWEHAHVLGPVLQELPALEAIAVRAFALPAEYVLATVGHAALRARLERAIDELRRDDTLRDARHLPAAARRVLHFAVHWSGGRDLVIAILDDVGLGDVLRFVAYQELAWASPVDAHAWAFRAAWNALPVNARVARLASYRHGDLDARATEEVGRALADPSSSVRHTGEWLLEARPDALARWRGALDDHQGWPWALRVLARRAAAVERHAALAALAQTWTQDTSPAAQERSLSLLIEHDAAWRDTCEAELRRAPGPTRLRHRQHAAAGALARIGDDDARTRLLRVSLDPAWPCFAEHLTPRWI